MATGRSCLCMAAWNGGTLCVGVAGGRVGATEYGPVDRNR